MDFFSPIFLGLVVTISFTWVGYSQPDDPAGFQSAPDISKLDIFYYHCHSIDSFTMKYKQIGYQQKVGVFIGGKDVTQSCRMIEHVNDEEGQWIIGYIHECHIQATKGRVDVKVIDGPLRLDKVTDRRYIDCSRHFPEEKKQQDDKEL